MDQGVKTAKLPIGEYIRMSSRFVLTTNQVVEIMLRWLECRDWEGAFLKVIPQRKQPMGKKAGADGEGDGKVEEVAGDEEEDGEGEEGEAGQDEEGGGGASEQGQHQKEETNDAMANVVEGIPPNAVAESTSTTKEPVETTI